ncbi:hypothetical protein [Gemella morbillorum]|uniref:hypothetical protein n=1 Tax=Gemella morbillorum TaxID=29391 RepID=UPI00319E1F30
MEGKKIRIIVGNSAYKENGGFGYSALMVKDLKDKDLKKIYEGIPEIAFIPNLNSTEEYSYLEVPVFRRVCFLLLGNNLEILNNSPEEIAKEFMFNNIYFVNASENNVSKLIENIKGVNEKEDYDIYILYTGNEAIEFSKKPLEIVQKSKIQKYKIIHPAARGKDMEVMQECWINFSYKEERYSKSEDILKKFRI